MTSQGMPPLHIGDLTVRLPIIQGGMGVGISLSGLASAVAEEGGVGVISTAGIGRLEPDFLTDLKAADMRGLRREIRTARDRTKGIIGVNIMMALSDYDTLLRVSVEEEVDLVFIGAGIPLRPPLGMTGEQMDAIHTRFVPKISSARAAEALLRSWDRSISHMPDALVIEGPLAGGHLGFTRAQIESGEVVLEDILRDVLEKVAPYEKKYGSPIPVIAAGGIYTGADIHAIMSLGASGVKMGTRFVATDECDAHEAFKQAFVDCIEEDLVIIDSPVGLPGRAIRSRLLTEVEQGMKKPYECPWRCLVTCDVLNAPYCIAKALTSAKNGDLTEGFAFAGANANLVDRIISVKELMKTLVKEFRDACAMKLVPLLALLRP